MLKLPILFSLLFFFSSLYDGSPLAQSAVGGCSMTHGELKVKGKYEYDSLNNLYRFKLGDTLKVYYTGYGGTFPYFEEYYYNGIYIGARLDTIKVGESCTVKIVYGCDNGSDFNQSLYFANNLVTGQQTLKQEELNFKTYFNSTTGNLHFLLDSDFNETYDVIVYSSSGQKLDEYDNLSSNDEHEYAVSYRGVVIIKMKGSNGQSTYRRVMLM